MSLGQSVGPQNDFGAIVSNQNNQNQGSGAPYLNFQYSQKKDNSTLSHLDDGLSGQARTQFILKVYLIVLLQLLLTIGMCLISYFVYPFFIFQITNHWMMWVLFFVMIAVEICILCLPIGRKHPFNIILLTIFTLSESYFVSYICAITAFTNQYIYHQHGASFPVLIAGVMTLAIVASLTFYAIFTPTDFSTKWGIIIVVLMSMMMLGIFCIWSPFLTNLYCFMGVILFGIYLVIDTQMIIGGRRFQISTDDYVIGALILYIDIVQMFLYLLALIGKR